MNETAPLVTIGIPTCNRASLLSRSLDSALNQDFSNLEVVISDNASTDDTAQVCESYRVKDARIKYFRQPTNVGPTDNFNVVLKNASGEFFMWLGDDDWIDASYIKICVQHLIEDPSLSLASGAPKYYREGQAAGDGRFVCLTQNRWYRRVISYYSQVSDNGIFYGVMRTADLRSITLPNTMGGDWLLIAGIVSLGKAKTITGIFLHREIGGLTTTYERIATSLGLRSVQAAFPMFSIASAAWLNIVRDGAVYRRYPGLTRLALGSAAFVVIALKPAAFHLRTAMVRLTQIWRQIVRIKS